MPSFGQELEILRSRRGITQHRLGLLAQVSPSSINRIEKGERGIPEITTLASIASALDLSVPERASLMEAAILDAVEDRVETLSIYYLLLTMNEETMLQMIGVLQEYVDADPDILAFLGSEKGSLSLEQFYKLIAGTATMPLLAHLRRLIAPQIVSQLRVNMNERNLVVHYGNLGRLVLGDEVLEPDSDTHEELPA